MQNKLFLSRESCCGCEACANVCPVRIIEMKSDAEGFFYPQIIDEEKCINCDKCQRVCPVKNVKPVDNFREIGYGGYSTDVSEVKSSASGGLATAISRSFVKFGGIVFGVAYNEDCTEVLFEEADSILDLEKFKTSKYVQARKYDVYCKVRNELMDGKRVLFIGLPCECYALQLYLGKEYENLYVCALICHGPTSQNVHTQYCEILKQTHDGVIKHFSVRFKKEGWKPYYIRAMFEDGYEHLERFADSYYGTAFLYMKRPSCNVCKIKRERIHSDITIGDYHLAYGGNFKPYNPDGVSSSIVHTKKGQNLISRLDAFLIEEIPVKNVLYSEAYCKAIPARRNRQEFGEVFSVEGLVAACGLKSISSIERELKIMKEIKTRVAKIRKLILGKKS